MTTKPKATTFDARFRKLHFKGQDLWSSCNSSIFIIHRSHNIVTLSASFNVRGAVVDAVDGIRQCFEPDDRRACRIKWHREGRAAMYADEKDRTRKWRRGSSALLAGVAKAWEQREGNERAAYLIYGVYGGKPICAASSEGQQLMESSWWEEVVLAAISNPVREWPPLPIRGSSSSSSAVAGAGKRDGKRRRTGGPAAVARQQKPQQGQQGQQRQQEVRQQQQQQPHEWPEAI